MSELTDFPTLKLEGRTYVLVPLEEFAEMTEGEQSRTEGDAVPWSIVRRHIEEEVSMTRAWREHLGLTQAEVAERIGISQPALSQIEKQRRPRKVTLQKVAKALGISVAQLKP